MATASPTTQPLVLALTQAFNATLQAGLATTSEVVFVDAFAENRRQLANPAHYALTNVTTVACDLTSPKNILATAGNADGSSLVCNASNLVTGDTSHYMFADNVHPTPYGHKLLAQYATKAMVIAGWL
jgi:phospholipase/lecithinase/hemolysin